MFDTVYLRMTGWYVAIIMTISLLFSVWVYNQASQELLFGLGHTPLQHVLVEEGRPTTAFDVIVDERLDESRHRLIIRLISLNLAILGAATFASYWLARRTMHPIEEALESQHRFTADASHELRTPLAAMKSEIEVGLRDKKLTKDEAVELLRSNLEEIDHMSGLTEGLLALTQTDNGFAAVPVSLEDIASKVVKRLQPLADQNKQQLKRELQPVIVLGTESSIDKIIGILLDNAIKYTPASRTIQLQTYKKDGHGYVVVQDEGVGIKAGELPHIFERFYRADSSRSKTNIPGHGLGLSIAQTLAQRLNGSIKATSKSGKGSTFTLKLPIAEP